MVAYLCVGFVMYGCVSVCGFCNVWVFNVWVCVCAGVVMCVCVCVGFVMCVCVCEGFLKR